VATVAGTTLKATAVALAVACFSSIAMLLKLVAGFRNTFIAATRLFCGTTSGKNRDAFTRTLPEKFSSATVRVTAALASDVPSGNVGKKTLARLPD
jgi:hypothetical protein